MSCSNVFFRAYARAKAIMFLSLTLAAAGGSASAATLSVGQNQQYKTPSEAAAVAKDGDTVEIAPGNYFDCAVWRANNLTVTGKGSAADVVISEKTCQGKGIFITAGDNMTVRNLTLEGARVPDGNGAGIRGEGVNLKVDSVRFVNNENGIMMGVIPKSVE